MQLRPQEVLWWLFGISGGCWVSVGGLFGFLVFLTFVGFIPGVGGFSVWCGWFGVCRFL